MQTLYNSVLYIFVVLLLLLLLLSRVCYALLFTSRRPFFIHKQNECGVSDRDTLTNDRDGDNKTARVLRENENDNESGAGTIELRERLFSMVLCVCGGCVSVCLLLVMLFLVMSVCVLCERVFSVHVNELRVSVFVCWLASAQLRVVCVCVCVFVTSTSSEAHNTRNGKTGATATAAATTTTRGSI